MGAETILIVEDEFRMRKLVGDFLKKEGYDILEAENGRKALDVMSPKIDLVILDVMLPEYDGWTVCRQIRKQYKTPIIMLTARCDEFDEIYGFEIGADEYITKPFRPKILVARVKALLRRVKPESNILITYKRLIIDENTHQVCLNGETLDMRPKEYELLLFLAKNIGKALSREQILDRVWGDGYFGDLRTVDTHINRLRIKLGNENDYIHTVRGLGYRFGGHNEKVNYV